MNPFWKPNKPACPKDEVYDNCRTVGQNAADAEAAIRSYTDAIADPDIQDYHISDMIANCLHLCDKYNFDADEVIRLARIHWEEER